MLLELPYDGHCMWADLTGDGLSQLLLYNGEKITIYSTEQTDLLKPAINRQDHSLSVCITGHVIGEAKLSLSAMQWDMLPVILKIVI